MSKDWKVEVKHDASGEVVKNISYNSENLRDKGYMGLLRNMNMDEYTAYLIDPDSSDT